MAQVVLGGIGGAVGGGVGRVIGATLGRMADGALIGALSPARQVGPRLDGLKIQGTAEGAPMPCVFGRARVAGQVIWAARFQERRTEQRGGKGGPKTVDYDYSLSFAVALGEGPIDGIGRVWADGQPMETAGIAMRLHRGTEDQQPDLLIEAVEGAAPAYRGTAYVVFEDLPLTAYGDRPPQLSFEVFRRPVGSGGRLEDLLGGVCLIPGAGEFTLATDVVLRREGLTRTRPENAHTGEGRADLLVSLDQLQAQAPNLKRVSLVVGWFGDDLRAGHCRVRPGVERRDKPTEPLRWSVAGRERENAYLISDVDGLPAYGGTPSDDSVRQAVRELKARGLEVTLYPFIFMDVPADNALPDPYGGGRQAPHPWRGRVRGDDGPAAAAQVAALFGEADGWGLKRMALHYARIAREEGADGLLIGSEMGGLTWTRDGAGGYPAVEQFRTLAAECRAVVGTDVTLSYAADWSEYFGHQPGTGDVMFHLDPLWADPNIDHVSIDWYAPLSDWREGDGGMDGLRYDSAADPAYLAANVAGGENFDWFHGGDAERAAQVRTPIRDTAHGEDWLFRPKDLKGWWSNAHHDRPGGVRRATPTAWVPGMKPVRLSEFGCAAVDRGGNAPNLFQDPKSSEGRLPPHSSGARDDAVQRAALEAVLTHYAAPANNPVSAVYGGRMLEGADAWCWDARPYPAFPARADVWADAGAWRSGHWLNGRLTGDARDLIAAVLRRGGVADDGFVVEGVEGAAAGYLIDRPMRTRDALAPLLTAFDAVAAERGGGIAVLGRSGEVLDIAHDDLALEDEGAPEAADRSLEQRPATARVRFIDEAADYQTGAVTVRSDEVEDGGGLDLDLPVACGSGLAAGAARRLLDGEGEEALTLAAGPDLALRVEPGDAVRVEGRAGVWRVEQAAIDETPRLRLRPLRTALALDPAEDWRGSADIEAAGAPLLRLLDLPPLPGAEEDDRPLVVLAAEPWRPMSLHVGMTADSLTARAVVDTPATVGVLLSPVTPGPIDGWDEGSVLDVRVEGEAPASASEAAVLGGVNQIAVECAGGGWELMQFRHAEMIGSEAWRLSGLLRAQQGTDGEMAAGAMEGALVVFLGAGLPRVDIGRSERGLPLICRAGPRGAPPGGDRFAQTVFTPRGVHHRPWSPAGLTVEHAADGALTVRWTPRARRPGVGWNAEGQLDARRYRIRVLDGDHVVRVAEATVETFTYAAGAVAEDFPDGLVTDVALAVAQWGQGYGWGVEARIFIGG